MSKTDLLTISDLEQHLQNKGINVQYNEITHDTYITGFDPSIYSHEQLQDIFPEILFSELQSDYKRLTIERIKGFLSVIADKNRFNPVLDIVNNLKWDKLDRRPELYNILSIDESDELSKTLIYKWLWQCLSMARNTGTTYNTAYGADGLLVLIGNQGIGKTSFFRKLAIEQRFFQEGQHIDFKDKDSYIRVTSTWITELGEFESSLRKPELGKLKAFITKERDVYRKPFRHADLHLARRTSFCATCNSTEFLIDPTGNRRFWSVPIDNIDIEALNRLNVKQLWAQIDYETRANPQGFRLTSDEQEQLASRNSKHEKPLTCEDEVRDIIEIAKRLRSEFIWEEINITQFKMAHEALKAYSVLQIAAALDKIGVEKLGQKYIDGDRQRVRKLPRKYLVNSRFADQDVPEEFK